MTAEIQRTARLKVLAVAQASGAAAEQPSPWARKLNAQPGQLIDVLPTVLAVPGVSYPATIRWLKAAHFEGTSLVPAFSGKPVARRQPIFFMHEGNRAVRGAVG